MRLLVTRPAEDSAKLRSLLEARGHQVVADPLIAVRPLDFALPEPPVAAIVLTSRHGARALADHPDTGRFLDTRVYCVGAATAEAARTVGFPRVVAGDNDWVALAGRIAAELAPDAGGLVHVRGRHAAGDLSGTLGRAGFIVREIIAYEARAAGRLAPETRTALASGALDGVLLFSPRSAAIFSRLAPGEAAGEPGRLTAYCLSEAVAAAVEIPGTRIAVAPRPTLDAMLDLVAGAGR